MSDIKNKINFFENIINKSESVKNNKSIKNNKNNKDGVKKKITHWNKIRKKILSETDIYNNDLLKNDNTYDLLKNDNTSDLLKNDNTSDDDEYIMYENSIIN